MPKYGNAAVINTIFTLDVLNFIFEFSNKRLDDFNSTENLLIRKAADVQTQSNCNYKSKYNCNYIFVYKVALARRQQRDLRSLSQAAPAHLSTTHGGGFTLSLLLLKVKQGSGEYQFLQSLV